MKKTKNTTNYTANKFPMKSLYSSSRFAYSSSRFAYSSSRLDYSSSSFSLLRRVTGPNINMRGFSYTSGDDKTKTTMSKNKLSFSIFEKLKYILDNKPINIETQMEIENYILSQVSDFINNKNDLNLLGVNSSYLTTELKRFCFDKSLMMTNSLSKLKTSFNSNKYLNKELHQLKTQKNITDFFFKNVLNTVSNDYLIECMLYIFLLVLTFNNVTKDKDGDSFTGVTNNAVKLGRLIVSNYVFKLYKLYCTSNPNSDITYTKFKNEVLLSTLIISNSSMNLKDYSDILFSNEFYLKIGTSLLDIMYGSSILHTKVIKTSKEESLATLKVFDDISSKFEIKNPILVTPLNLPMIVKPNPYSKDKLGGYLLNDNKYSESLIGNKIGYNIPSKVVDENIIYKIINRMMSSSFKVNKELLTYLLEENSVHKLLIDQNAIHEYEYLQRNKTQDKIYQEFLSKKITEGYIIEIAKTYANVPSIYFPIKLDNRGRMYTLPVYFNYQGCELSKALILFDCPDIIKRYDTSSINFLKAYGGSCYGHSLNRKSYNERLAWVDGN